MPFVTGRYSYLHVYEQAFGRIIVRYRGIPEKRENGKLCKTVDAYVGAPKPRWRPNRRKKSTWKNVRRRESTEPRMHLTFYTLRWINFCWRSSPWSFFIMQFTRLFYRFGSCEYNLTIIILLSLSMPHETIIPHVKPTWRLTRSVTISKPQDFPPWNSP